MDVVNKVYVSWEEVEQLVNELAHGVILHCPDIEYIHGLERGGYIPAVILSHKLHISYTKFPHNCVDKCLIVDDICDSGYTLKRWEDYRTAVLHYKPHTSCCEPTLWSEAHKTDDWIVYPWERNDSETIQDYKLDK